MSEHDTETERQQQAVRGGLCAPPGWLRQALPTVGEGGQCNGLAILPPSSNEPP